MMKKISVIIVLLGIIVTSTISARAQTTLIHGVIPTMGHATGSVKVRYENWSVQCEQTWNIWMEFWNVGAYGPNQEGIANFKFTDDGTGNESLSCQFLGMSASTKFSGGPNGVFTDPFFSGTMVNGRTIEVTITGEVFSGSTTTTLTVDDPTIFDGWTDLAPTETPLPANLPTLEDSLARFSDLAGMVEVNIPGPDGKIDDEAWNYAELNTVMPVGTHIRTSDRYNSSAIISFADMTTFVMKPGDHIILSSAHGHDSQIQLLMGNLWANVKKMARDGSLQVEMSQAVAGIKGTTFIVQETGASSTLMVIEGTVDYTSKADGVSVQVSAGQQATATSSGMGPVTSFDVSAYQDYGTIRPTNSSASGNPGIKPVNLIIFVAIGSFCLIVIGAIAVGIVLLLRKKARPGVKA